MKITVDLPEDTFTDLCNLVSGMSVDHLEYASHLLTIGIGREIYNREVSKVYHETIEKIKALPVKHQFTLEGLVAEPYGDVGRDVIGLLKRIDLGSRLFRRIWVSGPVPGYKCEIVMDGRLEIIHDVYSRFDSIEKEKGNE